jgi:low temperature requirement protein LtrA
MPRFASAGLRRDPGVEQRTTTLELFYDLVFVFAVTQVSHLLLFHLTWEGAGQSVIVLMVVWWAWNYTTWVTNELDPESTVVRVLLIALMLLSLLIAVAIPEAFGDRALLFAGSYVALQVGRHAFLTFAAAEPGTLERIRAGRILIWFCLAAPFWIAGGLADGEARTALWIVALAIDYSAPLLTYRLPFLPPIDSAFWHVQASHFTERFQLFVIIALGESIVLIGATTAGLDLDLAILTAFACAFLGAAALWWLYFNFIATAAVERLAAAENSTIVARDAYTYLHAVIIAGIIVTAVGDELVIAHPTEQPTDPELIAIVAGPAIYLLSHVLLRLRLDGTVSRRRLAGVLACVVIGLAAGSASALVVGALLLAVLIAEIAGDQRAAAKRRSRSPGNRELAQP